MTFLEPFLLWAIPAAAIPLLIALFFRLNRKTLDFPSLRILEEVLKSEKTSERLSLRVRHFVRVAVIALLCLAFAMPVFRKADGNRECVAIIEDGPATALTPWKDALNDLRETGHVAAVFVGKRVYSEGEPKRAVRTRSFSKDVREALSSLPAGYDDEKKLTLLTYGGESGWKESISVPDGYAEAEIIRLPRVGNNPERPEVSVFPAVAVPGNPLEFNVSVNRMYAAPARMRLFLENETLYDGPVRDSLRIVKKVRESDVKTPVLTGFAEVDEGKSPERSFFALPVLKRPLVFDRTGSDAVKKTAAALFPGAALSSDAENPDLAFSDRFERKWKNVPVIFFSDNREAVTEDLVRLYGITPEWREETARGEVRSAVFPVMEAQRDVELRLDCSFPGSPRAAEIILTVDGKPACYRFGNRYFLPFSLRNNAEFLSSSSFLLFLSSEILQNEIVRRSVTTVPDPSAQYTDLRGLQADVEREAGLFLEKGSGRILVNNPENVRKERVMSLDKLKKLVRAGKGVRVEAYDYTPGAKTSGRKPLFPEFYILLAVIAALLLLLSVPKQGDSPSR
jgi:hypothetical protein